MRTKVLMALPTVILIAIAVCGLIIGNKDYIAWGMGLMYVYNPLIFFVFEMGNSYRLDKEWTKSRIIFDTFIIGTWVIVILIGFYLMGHN
ncbi:LasU family protein [Lactobacillus terrae]|uniref:LasU family protein n=1 Tax=Lactobacillus terrae TaxID=2269374 RepID=UPI000C1B7946|nr:LasU family protein [Lactobacillus terrae]